MKHEQIVVTVVTLKSTSLPIQEGLLVNPVVLHVLGNGKLPFLC